MTLPREQGAMLGEFGSKDLVEQQGYDDFCHFLAMACGIVLGENRQYLVSSRLDSLMEAHGVASLAELVADLKQHPGSKIYIAVVDAMTTNETSWFRDGYPYDFLYDQLLPYAVAKHKKNLRIWSAAASSGQEPYSISIIVDEYLKNRCHSLTAVDIVATDISQSVLNSAKEGVFHQSSLDRGMSQRRVAQYFDEKGALWKIKDEIKQRIAFREFNLLGSFSALGKFDIIFCRNVLIYFSAETRKDILVRIARALNPLGYLVLGGAESIANYSDSFNVVRLNNGLVYQLKE